MAYSPRTAEILVNGPTAGNQSHPSVTRLANGNLLAVYATPSTINNDQWGIQGQLFDPAGNKIGSFFWITPITLRNQANPDVAALPNGGFALTWTFSSLNGTNIYSGIFDANGAPVSGERFLDFHSGFLSRGSSIVGLANGSAAIVWADYTTNPGSDSAISGAILAPNGTVQNFSVVTNSGGEQFTPEITALTGGNFVVAWSDTSGVGGDADSGAIKAQIFNAAGGMVGGEFLVNTTVAGSQNTPYVAALPTGGFVAVWDSPGGDRGQIFDANGNKVGGEFAVAGAGPVGVRTDGGFAVTFSSDADGSGNGVVVQQYAADGAPIGGPVPVNTAANNSQILPDVAVVDNDLFIVWQDDSGVGGDNSGTGIKGRLFTSLVSGTEGQDQFTGTAGGDEFQGLGDSDTFLLQQGGNDRALGNDGDDTFYFGNAYTADDRVDGGAGNDRLILQGQYGNLQLNALSLVNVETILLLTASNAAFGGAGANPTFYSITSADANLAGGSSMAVDGRQLAANEYLNFNGSAETDGAFFLYGGAAADSLTGGAGRDTLDGGAGNDSLAGGANDDIYFVDHPGDVVLESVGGGGFDAVYASINYVLRAGSEIEQLAATGLALGQAIDLTGNEFAQSLVTGSGHDALNGGGGADFLTANAGNDILNGGTGVDYMDGGAGDDIYYVDDVFDTVIEQAGGGNDSVYASATYQLSGGAQVELLATTGLALGQAITLFGNDFAQSIIGATGNDILYGFGGADSIVGNEGNDTLDGGGGNDVLRGGLGLDIFQFSSVADSTGAGDIVLDFLNAVDKIDLSLIDANVNVPGNHAFTYIGTSAFSNVAGQLRVESSGGLVNVLGDVDGDGAADLIIHLYNTGGLVPTAGDFIL